MIKVLQDWTDRCEEKRLRMNEALTEYKRAEDIFTRELNDEPRICATCTLWANGECARFRSVPPAEFQQKPGACSEWEVIVPF